MIRLVAGLGNPGKEYELTRHNLGFVIIDELIEKLDLNLKTLKSLNSQIAEKEKILLLKPLTFMNLSGEAIRKAMFKYSVNPGELLIICDDFSLPLGKLRLRMKGSSGGHNGIESIIKLLGTQEFPRLRLGIGPLPAGNADSKAFVLSRFSAEEKTKVKKMVQKATLSVFNILNSESIQAAMEKINSAEQ